MIGILKKAFALRMTYRIQRIVGLILSGHSEDALAYIEEDAGIAPEPYTDRCRLKERLQKRLVAEEPDMAALYVRCLAWVLFKLDRSQDAAVVMEADFEVEPGDYKDLARLAERLRLRLSPLAPEIAVQHLHFLSESLGFADRQADRLSLWLADLGLERSAERSDIVHAFRARVERIDLVDARYMYMLGIWSALTTSGRMEEATSVLCSFFKVEDGDEALGSDQLVQEFHSFTGSLDLNTKASLVLPLIISLLAQERKILGFTGKLLDLEPEWYSDPEQVSEILESWRSSMMSGLFWNLVSILVMALILDEKNESALLICRAAARPESGSSGDLSLLGSTLREHRDALSEERLVLFAGVVSMALVDADDPRAAVTLLEGFADLHPEDYRDKLSLAGQLAVPLQEWKIGLAGGLMSALLGALRSAGETERAMTLVEVCVDRFDPVLGLNSLDFVPGLVEFYSLWLEYFGFDSHRQPLKMCRDFVRFLRSKLAFHGVELKDRVDFITYTKDLRARVIETGLLWAQRESDPRLASRISMDVQLWDAELAQRLLVERFLLEPIHPVPRGESPTTQWPWSDEIERPDRNAYLPDEALVGKNSGALDESAEAAHPLKAIPGAATRLQEDHPALFQRAREIVIQGIDEAQMARSIGAAGVLLRATFGSQGQLLWFALLSDGRHIDIVAQEVGTSGDLDRLRWAAARHDFRSALARFWKKYERRLPGTIVSMLAEVGQCLEALSHHLSSEGSPEGLSRQLGQISQSLSTHQSRDVLTKLLVPVLGPLQAAPGREGFPEWARGAAEQLQIFRELLSGRSPMVLQPELNQITADYIQEVGSVWSLEKLGEVLSPETDLIVQVDDALHTVPIACMPVAGEPLFRRVRSVRSSLALLMTSLQLETEQEIRRDPGEPVRLLNVSHFKRDDVARDGAVWLQHGLSVLARRYDCQVYGAADEPAGSVGLLRTALEDLRNFRVLAVCGHGDFFKSGIELAGSGDVPGSLWEGGGCDLSGVDWLWMVSCSIGRLGQNGDRDVEGFCVRLALHRARSVAAFRWPVHSLEAVALVNESVRLYLEALESTAGGDVRCLRARALNDARKNFFGDGFRPPLYSQVGLNTAAACELFGLG